MSHESTNATIRLFEYGVKLDATQLLVDVEALIKSSAGGMSFRQAFASLPVGKYLTIGKIASARQSSSRKK
jgi:hypothetical protein